MLALSPPLFPSLGWPLEMDPISQEQHMNYLYGDYCTEATSGSFPQLLPPSSEPFELSTPSTADISTSGDLTMVKKLNHNASERDRRKKINHLYNSLRALLPSTDHTKKLSIPATISRVLKYVPELQEQVEGLVRKKEELKSRMRRLQGNLVSQEKKIIKNRSGSGRSLSSVSASQLNDREIAIQISTHKVNNNPISEILLHLQEDGLSILNASSFESFQGMLFHNLHLQVERFSMECEMLGEKLMSLYEKREELLP